MPSDDAEPAHVPAPLAHRPPTELHVTDAGERVVLAERDGREGAWLASDAMRAVER